MNAEPRLQPIDPWAEKLLLKAAEDETILKIEGVPDGPFGFHAQQAVEKFLKALLCQLGAGFDRTHDVARIAAQLADMEEPLPETPIELVELNRFAVVYRYDSIPFLDVPDRPSAIETVRLIREHVLARINALRQNP